MSDFTIGLDLGQASDFTAVAVLQRGEDAGGGTGRARWSYDVRHLQRFSLGTPYTDIVPAVTTMASSRQLKGSPLVVDQTGVGRALVDMLKAAPGAGRVVPVTITAGHQVTETEDRSWHVPKKELVTCLQLLLQGRRLRVARTLRDAEVLVRELENFKVKITVAANESFGAWREGQHDDLVLAVALACWWAEKHPPWGPNAFSCGGGSIIAQAPPGVFLT